MEPTPAGDDRLSILVVDDTPDNLALMSGLLRDAYKVKIANGGEKALRIAQSESPPDLILLDIMMPGMDGYEVCRQLKADPATRDIPVIFLTAKSEVEDERRGLELGAVDYLTKPVSPPIVLARVRNHLALRQQAKRLEEWNRLLEQRVAEGVAEVSRLNRLRRFFSPAVADFLLHSGEDQHLQPHRRDIVVVFLDLRGYTDFTERFGAEEVMRALGEFHAAMGELIMAHGGTLERFTGDGMMIFFNDPVQIEAPAVTAIGMARAMQTRYRALEAVWQERGYHLGLGIGIAEGEATLGTIGFEGRRDYAAIGRVTNLAARLCGEAAGGQILVCPRAASNAAGLALEPAGTRQLKGFAGGIAVHLAHVA